MKTLYIWHTPAGVDFDGIQFQPGILEADNFTWADWVEARSKQDIDAALACHDLVLIHVIEGKDRPSKGVEWRLGITMINEPDDRE